MTVTANYKYKSFNYLKMFKNCFEYIKFLSKTQFLNNPLDLSRDAVIAHCEICVTSLLNFVPF